MGSAAADPVAEPQLRAAVGGRCRPRRARADHAGGRPRRCVLRRGVRPHRRAASGRREDVVHLVRHDRHARLARCADRAGPPAQPRVRAAVPAPPGHGQGVRHPRPAHRRAGHPRCGCRPPRVGVHGARRGLRHAWRAGRGGDPRDPGRLRRGVPDRRRSGCRGRCRHGPEPGAGRWPADLAGWLVEGRDPSRRDARGRLAAPGPAAHGHEHRARVHPHRARGRRAARSVRHRGDRRAGLPRHPRLRGRELHRHRQRRADRRAVPEAHRQGHQPAAVRFPRP